MELKLPRTWLGVLLLFSVLAVVVFRSALEPDEIFSASDANIGLLQSTQNILPQGFVGAFRSAPLLGASSKASVQTKTLLLSILPSHVVNDLIYPLYLVLGSLALIAFLRLWCVGWRAAVFGAVTSFWMGSITLAAAGHDTKLSVAALFALSLFLLEKAIRSSGWKLLGYAMLGGGTIGWMLLEQQDIALFFGLFLGSYVLFRLMQTGLAEWQRWVAVLVPVAGIALLLSATTAMDAYTHNVSAAAAVQSDSPEKWNFITQWSMVPKEWPDLIAPGYTGWRTNDPEGPYWGDIGQSAEWATTQQGFRNFRLDSSYIGILPLFFACLGIVAIWKARKNPDAPASLVFFWSGACLVTLLLATGKYSPLYRLFYHLPLVNNIRAPIKFLHVFQVALGMLAAVGIDGLAKDWLEGKVLKRIAVVGTGLAGFMLLAALINKALPASAIESFTAQGWGQYAPVIVSNIAVAWLHAGIMALVFAGGLFALVRMGKKVLPWFILIAAGAVMFDSAWLTSRYFSTTKLGTVRKGNDVINYLENNQGIDRVYLFDQQGVYNQWLSMDFPYHGINCFNVWQMPRMESDYKEYLGTVGRDYRKLLKLASVRYALAPAAYLRQLDPSMFKPVMYYRFVQNQDRTIGVQPLMNVSSSQDQAVLEVKGTVPRFALFPYWRAVKAEEACTQLVAPSFDPLSAVLLSGQDLPVCAMPQPLACQPLVPASLDLRSVVLKTGAPTPGILMFTQHYQAEWKAYVDGKEQPLLRCNYLAMGVQVPAGDHEVRFACPTKSEGLVLQGIGASLALCGFVFIAIGRKDESNDG